MRSVKLAGKRVAVIGTGSSGHPVDPADRRAGGASDRVPAHAELCAARPQWSGTGGSRWPLLEGDRAGYREQARWSLAGVPYPQQTAVSWQLSDAERRERFEQAWAAGDLVYILTQLWADQGVDVDGNALIGELIREKIRAHREGSPRPAAALSPHDHPFGAKRPCLDTNYYATYNRPNVTLVNLRQEPIKPITASGITTDKRSVRCRRDRVRHRLRRHDRRDHGGASDHRPRRQIAVRRLGHTGRRPISASPSPASPTCS